MKERGFLPLLHEMEERAGVRRSLLKWTVASLECPSPQPSPRSFLAGRGRRLFSEIYFENRSSFEFCVLTQATVSLRLKNIKLLSYGETHRVGKRRVEIIGAAGLDGIGSNPRPLVQGLGEIRARQQIKCPAELAGCRELQICVG